MPDDSARRSGFAAGSKQRIAVVGGGMLGLTLSLRLARRGYPVTVFESSAEPGGLAAPWQLGDYVWDRFYHVILLSDASLRGLLEELDLEAEVDWRQTRTGFFTDGSLHSVSDTLEFLRFPALGLIDKLRLAGTIAYAARLRNWQRLEEIPVIDWLRRFSGRTTYEKIWLPLLRAKLGDNYRQVSAAFIWATIARMYAARRSGLKKEMFGFVRGGYATILKRLTERVAASGVELRTSSPVERIEQRGSGMDVVVREGGNEAFDAAVMTAPTPVAAQICPGLTGAERARLRDLPYQGIVCASMLLSRPLGPFYITNITDAGLPFTGVIEMGALIGTDGLGGQSLVYLPCYLTQSDPMWESDDESLRQLFVDALGRMYPDFRPQHVGAFRVARARHVQALPTLHYSRDWAPPTESSVPGLYFATSAQIVNSTLNVNETVALANRKAEELAALLAG